MLIATAFAKAGATIVFNDIKQELVDKGLAAYKEEGINAHGYVCDGDGADYFVKKYIDTILQKDPDIDTLILGISLSSTPLLTIEPSAQ